MIKNFFDMLETCNSAGMIKILKIQILLANTNLYS